MNRMKVFLFALFLTSILFGSSCSLLKPSSISKTSTTQNNNLNNQKDIKADYSNLQQIGMAISIYSSDHKQDLPDDLSLLFEERILPDDCIVLFHNPVSKTKPTLKLLKENKADYLYLGKGQNMMSIDDPSKTPILITRPGLFLEDFINILFADLHVEGCRNYKNNPILIEQIKNQKK